MKFTAILLLALIAFSSAQFLRKADVESSSADQVDTTVDINGINTAVSNIEAVQGINKSNVVVLSKVNFGTIVQQLGEFSAVAQQTTHKLRQAEADSQDTVNTDVEISDVNTAVSNIQAAQVINESNVVALENVNFGTIVQQLGEFSASAEQVHSNMRRLQADEPSNDSQDDVTTDVELSDVNTAVSNIQAAQIINESNVVIIDKVNFGTIVQQLGEFSALAQKPNSMVPNTNLRQGSADTVDTDVSLSNINTAVSNIQAAQVINESNVVIIDDVNFGTIVQQLGEFDVSLKELVANAREI